MILVLFLGSLNYEEDHVLECVAADTAVVGFVKAVLEQEKFEEHEKWEQSGIGLHDAAVSFNVEDSVIVVDCNVNVETERFFNAFDNWAFGAAENF